jgi:tetratricopeptide (TPR) repeat protein
VDTLRIMEEELADLRHTADARPDDAEAQIGAAYACDAAGHETEAVAYYDRAWHLGVPFNDRHDFLIGYGSTLKNVGRVDDSLHILQTAADEFPGDLAPLAFIALSLDAAGRSREAVALLLDCLITAQGPGIARFEVALSSYAELLRE